jgi:predicted MPP superfamily phosphohydrolase
VYAVMGNHDWWHDGAKFTAAFTRAGITVLENDAVPFAPAPPSGCRRG